MTQQNMISPGELERTISDLMLELGIPAHLRGYQFLRSAIGMCVEDMECDETVIPGSGEDVSDDGHED